MKPFTALEPLGTDTWYDIPAYARKGFYRLNSYNRYAATKYYAALLAILSGVAG